MKKETKGVAKEDHTPDVLWVHDLVHSPNPLLAVWELSFCL